MAVGDGLGFRAELSCEHVLRHIWFRYVRFVRQETLMRHCCEKVVGLALLASIVAAVAYWFDPFASSSVQLSFPSSSSTGTALICGSSGCLVTVLQPPPSSSSSTAMVYSNSMQVPSLTAAIWMLTSLDGLYIGDVLRFQSVNYPSQFVQGPGHCDWIVQRKTDR